MATLWASHHDLHRLREAGSAVVLVGGYDGSGNYGDVLQVATAIETVGALPEAPLPVAVVEHETRGHHLELAARFGPQLGNAAYVYFKNDEDPSSPDLVELGAATIPARAAIYVYGGGFLNHRWGGRKVEHAVAANRVSRRRRLPVVASGLQVDEAAVAPGGVAYDLLSRAAAIGVRDVRSLEYLRKHLPPAVGRGVGLTGDDAVPFLRPAPARPDSVVNLHINDGVWVSDDPDAMAAGIVRLLCEVGRASPERLELQPVVAYEDPRVSERRAHVALADRFGSALEDAGYSIADPVDLLDDAIENELTRFRRARLTVACSYHVTLTSLLSAIPTVLLAENEYYEQKAQGLRHLFGLEQSGLLGADGNVGSVATEAASIPVAGPARERALADLRGAGALVVERWEGGRAKVAQALVATLRPARLRRVVSRFRGA